MIRTIFWKEWREQRTIIAAVLAFGGLVLFATAQLVDTSYTADGGARAMMPMALAYLAGSVTGAMLLADEKESRTIEFLDSLPSRRISLWFSKASYGLISCMAQGLALGMLAVLIGCYDDRFPPVAYAFAVILITIIAFSWGMFGGAIAETSLGAVFKGTSFGVLAAIVLAVPMTFMIASPGLKVFELLIRLIYVFALGIFGLIGSAILFSNLDRDRRSRSNAPQIASTPKPPKRKRIPGFGALIWLSARQSLWITLGCFGGAVVMGGSLLLPDADPLFMWPSVTLAFGVIAGVTTFSEEQGRGIARFWAERRLPLGRLWVSKMVFHFAIAAGSALIVFLPQLAIPDSPPFRSLLLELLPAERARFIWLGLIYGFVFGHLMGFAFKKTVVSGLVAMLTSVTTAGLLLPALLGGGLHDWQVWTPAILLLLTSRWLLYPWATGRVLERGPLTRIALGSTAAVIALGLSIGYRVYEIPDAPDRYAASGFEANLIPYDENKAGQELRSAASQFGKAANTATNLYPKRPISGVEEDFGGREWLDPLDFVRARGWSSESEKLAPWLDAVFDETWERYLDEAAKRPIGVFDDPRDVDYFTRLATTIDLRTMVAALCARSLQRQATGNAGQFVRFVRGGLAAVRSARNQDGLATVTIAFQCEQMLFETLHRWLNGKGIEPEFLKDVAWQLREHDRLMPRGSDGNRWAEHMILRNTLDRSNRWLPQVLSLDRNASKLSQRSDHQRRAEAEMNLIGIAWNVPWEKARRERILRRMTTDEVMPEANRGRTRSHYPVSSNWLSPLQMPDLWEGQNWQSIETKDRLSRAQLGMAEIQVALRRFEANQGHYPTNLEELVPTYLDAVPLDPHDRKPFKYRVSNGEMIQTADEEKIVNLNGKEIAVFEMMTTLSQMTHGLDLRQVQGLDIELTSVPSPQVARIFSLRTTSNAVKIKVPAGGAIVWSVGSDGKNDGGILPSVNSASVTALGEDWIVVALPRVGRK